MLLLLEIIKVEKKGLKKVGELRNQGKRRKRINSERVSFPVQ